MTESLHPAPESSPPGGHAHIEKPPYRIFISYASEDKAIASALHEALTTVYRQSQDLKVDLMKEFELGSQWRTQIDDSLTHTDLLLLVYTGQVKPSHSWTGYEIGFFSREIQRRNERFPNVKREIIPINFLGKRETVTEVIEGIEFPRELVTRPEINNAQLGLSSDGFGQKFSEGIPWEDPLYKLFRKIATNVESCTGRRSDDNDRHRRDESLKKEVVTLYKNLHSLIREMKKEDQGLQNKIIVSVNQGKDSREDTTFLTIEFQHSAEAVFQLTDVLRASGTNQLEWKVFEKEVTARNGRQAAALWIANLIELVRSAHPGEFVDRNVLFQTRDQKETYRAVVTRRVEFHSGRTEVHIYLFELYQRAEYGDPHTSIYLNALEVACRYRSLFLEPLSQFSPKWMRQQDDNTFRNGVLRMIRELDLIHQDSLENKLNTIQGLGQIFGEDGAEDVVKVKGVWAAAEERLRNAAAKLVQCNDTSNSNFGPLRKSFDDELLNFCLETNPVNADYLKRAIKKLASRTEELMAQLDASIEKWKAGNKIQTDAAAP